MTDERDVCDWPETSDLGLCEAHYEAMREETP